MNESASWYHFSQSRWFYVDGSKSDLKCIRAIKNI